MLLLTFLLLPPPPDPPPTFLPLPYFFFFLFYFFPYPFNCFSLFIWLFVFSFLVYLSSFFPFFSLNCFHLLYKYTITKIDIKELRLRYTVNISIFVLLICYICIICVICIIICVNKGVNIVFWTTFFPVLMKAGNPVELPEGGNDRKKDWETLPYQQYVILFFLSL